MFTAGIGYLTLLFNTNGVLQEDLPYVGLLKSVLGYVDTEHYTYGDLTSEIYLNSGGIDFSVTSYPNLQDLEKFTGRCVEETAEGLETAVVPIGDGVTISVKRKGKI